MLNEVLEPLCPSEISQAVLFSKPNFLTEGMIGDYAAALATAIQKSFWDSSDSGQNVLGEIYRILQHGGILITQCPIRLDKGQRGIAYRMRNVSEIQGGKLAHFLKGAKLISAAEIFLMEGKCLQKASGAARDIWNTERKITLEVHLRFFA